MAANFCALTTDGILEQAKTTTWNDRDTAEFFNKFLCAFKAQTDSDKAIELAAINQKLLNALNRDTEEDKKYIDAILTCRNAQIFLAECLLLVPASDMHKNLDGFKKLRHTPLSNETNTNAHPFNLILAATVAAEIVRNSEIAPENKIKKSAAYRVVNTHLVDRILDRILGAVTFGSWRTATAVRLDKAKKLFTNGLDSTYKVTEKILLELDARIEKLADREQSNKFLLKSTKDNVTATKTKLEELRKQFNTDLKKQNVTKSQDDVRTDFDTWEKTATIIKAGFFGPTGTQNFVKRAKMLLNARERELTKEELTERNRREIGS